MSLSLSIHEAAEAEIDEAADFYDSEEPGLGFLFLDELERTLMSLAAMPEAARVTRGAVRKKPMAKFPFSLIYSVRNNEIRVLAVAHQRRRPFYWRGRR